MTFGWLTSTSCYAAALSSGTAHDGDELAERPFLDELVVALHA
jgi:hypothetical protein